jgi:hypothetical protein
VDVRLILDNYGTHKTAKVRNWLDQKPALSPALHAHPASWLSLVERWFVALTEKRLSRGVPRSTGELQAAIARLHQRPQLQPMTLRAAQNCRSNPRFGSPLLQTNFRDRLWFTKKLFCQLDRDTHFY